MAVSATVTPGKIFQPSEVVSISELNKLGSPTIDIAGAVGSLSLTDGSVTNAKVAASTGIQLNKLEVGTNAQVAVADSAGALALQSMTGDVTITNLGVTALATDSVVTTNITDANVTEAKLIAAVVNKLLPPGLVAPYIKSAAAPTGWLYCDGEEVLQSAYPDLYAIILHSYGTAAAPSTHFVLPDLRGRVPVGVDGTAARLSADDTLAAFGGVEEVNISTAQLPVHSHVNVLTNNETTSATASQGGAKPWVLLDTPTAMEDDGKWRYNNGNYGSGYPSSGRDMYAGDDSSWEDYQNITNTSDVTIANADTGSGSATNLLQPYQVFEYIIKT
jgi:microcystin-dependent protein